LVGWVSKKCRSGKFFVDFRAALSRLPIPSLDGASREVLTVRVGL